MAASDFIERELKLPLTEPAEVQQTVEQEGAQIVLARHWERNWVLDRGDELLLSYSLLRVRDRWDETGGALGAVVTMKKPLQAADDGVKERLEHELTVADAGAAIRLFAQLEYRVVRRYHKVRTAWSLDEHEIVLDETPIGAWLEIEGPDPPRVARRLHLPEAGDMRSYLSIYEAARAECPDLPCDMIFEGAHPPGFEGVEPPATPDA